MQLNSTEIADLIKQRISQFEVVTESRDEGTIISVSDGVIRIHGLNGVMQGEMIELPGNRYGLAMNLERDSVGAIVMGPYADLTEGQKVKCTGKILQVPVGESLLGRVVDTLGRPIDGKGPINSDGFSPVEVVAPGVISRKSVSQPIQTGYKSGLHYIIRLTFLFFLAVTVLRLLIMVVASMITARSSLSPLVVDGMDMTPIIGQKKKTPRQQEL